MVQPFRTIALIGPCFGLRISEILSLCWTDFDFKRSVVLIQRSAVGKRLNKLKTEYSQDEVPIERGFILELRKWQALCLDSEGHWLFPSPVTGRPYHADSIRTDYLVPTGLKLGLGRIGFHTFRHTYRAWTRPEHPWACSRNSCDTRTFLQRWTGMEMPQLWPSAKPIAQSRSASCEGLPIKRSPFNK
jgi:integrase